MNDLTPETQNVIDGIKIAVLKEEVARLMKQLEPQPCKQNCRTAKENYIAGYHKRDREIYEAINRTFGAEESYKERKGE